MNPIRTSEDAQLVALALVVLGEQRPGWKHCLEELAGRLEIRSHFDGMIWARTAGDLDPLVATEFGFIGESDS